MFRSLAFSSTLVITSLLFTPCVQANPGIKILFGIEAVTKLKMEAYNPIQGLVVRPYLEGIRYYGNNSDVPNDQFHCIARNRIDRLTNQAVPDKWPQDAVVTLVQWFFPDQGELDNFAVNNRIDSQDPAAFLTPKLIGKILNEIALWEQELINDTFLTQNITKHLKQKIQNKVRNKNIAKFSKAVMDALKHVKGQNKETQEVYHPNIVQASLLAVAWEKARHKQDIMDLLEAMPTVVDQQGVETYRCQEKLFNQVAYFTLKEKIQNNPKEQLSEIDLTLAALGFLAYEKSFPEKIPFTQVLLPCVFDPSNGYEMLFRIDKLVETFPDCVESALRTILNFILFDPINKVFQPAWLGLDPNHPLVRFYEKYNTLDLAMTTEAREQWALTLAYLPGMEHIYKTFITKEGKIPLKPQCEIKAAGLSNGLAIIGALLDLKPTGTEEGMIDTSILTQFLERVSKESDISWHWKVNGNWQGNIFCEEDQNVLITFYKANQEMVTWKIIPGHFDTIIHARVNQNWLSEYGSPLHSPIPLCTSLFYNQDYTPNSITQAIEKVALSDLSVILYSANLRNIDKKLQWLTYIAEQNLFKGLGKRLIDGLYVSRDDYYTCEKICETVSPDDELTQHLLQSWKIDLKEDRGMLLVNAVVKYGSNQTLQFLIKNGANLNAELYGYTPLVVGINSKKKESIKTLHLLLENKADPTIVISRSCKTALHYLLESHPTLETVKLLYDYGATLEDIDLLWTAAKNRNSSVEIMQFLLRNRSPISIKDEKTYATLLTPSAYPFGCEIVKFVLNRTDQPTTSLNLELYDEQAILLSKILSTNTILKTLKIYSKDLIKGGMLALAQMLKENNTLINLNLFRNYYHYVYVRCPTDEIKYLGQALALSTTLTTVKLDLNWVEDEEMAPITGSLTTNRSITSFDFKGMITADKTLEQMGQALAVNSTLVFLKLHWHEKLTDVKSMAHFARGLEVNTSLTELDLMDCKLGDMGIKSLADALKSNKSLKKLLLFHNKIKSQGATYLAQALESNVGLTFLDLNMNKIRDEGAKHMGEMLKRNSTLKTLILCRNDITNVGMQYLMEGLQSNTSLTSLNIQGSPGWTLANTMEKETFEKFQNLAKQKGIEILL